MATELNVVRTAFDAIKLNSNEKIKVWDVLLSPEGIKRPWQLTPKLKKGFNSFIDEYSEDNLHPNSIRYTGRVRILAVMNKKPELLENIRFAVAWCAPSDLNRYTRIRANNICVGRWNKAFANPDCETFSVETNILNSINYAHVGVIPKLETLKGFVEEALFHVNGNLPRWVVDHCSFDTANLAGRINKEYIDG